MSRAIIEPVERWMSALARECLKGVAAGIQGQDFPVQVAIVQGHPHHEIVRFAEAN